MWMLPKHKETKIKVKGMINVQKILILVWCYKFRERMWERVGNNGERKRNKQEDEKGELKPCP